MNYEELEKRMNDLSIKYGDPKSVNEEDIYLALALGHFTEKEFEKWLGRKRSK